MGARLGLLEQVKIPSAERRLKNFPHEMSGGMRQRAMIALALACKPERAAGRRTDHRARRHGADPDPAAAAPVAGRTGHGDRLRHPRRRRRGRDLRPHRRDVCRPVRRNRDDPQVMRSRGIPIRGGCWPRRCTVACVASALETIPGSPPNLAQSAARLPLRAALPLCHGCVPAWRNPVRDTETGAMARCVRRDHGQQ